MPLSSFVFVICSVSFRRIMDIVCMVGKLHQITDITRKQPNISMSGFYLLHSSHDY